MGTRRTIDVLECQAVLFDLDGVLVDSLAVVERTWQRWAFRHQLVISELVRQRAHGRRSVETVRELAPGLDVETEVQWLAATELGDTEGLEVLPGAAAALNALPDTHRAIVTSGGRSLALLRLTHVQLPVPGILVTAEDVVTGKPAPDGYRLAAERLHTDPSACVVIEDAPAGIAAGRSAGAIVVAVATTFPAAALEEADFVVPSLAHLRIVQVGTGVRISFPTDRWDSGVA
jgi:mannitol-1-/sugar-/sorbitol-6-phosphatase